MTIIKDLHPNAAKLTAIILRNSSLADLCQVASQATGEEGDDEDKQGAIDLIRGYAEEAQ